MKQKLLRCSRSFPLLFLGILIFNCSTAFAQDPPVISGTILDQETEEPLPGVNVVEKGTRNGTTTDFDGEYSLELTTSPATLVFTYLGFQSQEVEVEGSRVLDIALVPDLDQLDEVTIVDYGYGKVRKEDMTGSVASIGSEELSKIPVANAAEALSGRLPGVNVTTADGEPGAQVRIRVRGGGSITQSNEPLYVVDGFIVDGINDIPPTDIESINVLKDAAATAVYGAQAANGVVVVTTKNPVAGKVTVSYNNFFQFNNLPADRRYEVLSPHEYVFANYEYAKLQSTTALENFERFFGVYDDMDIYRNRQPTDWQEELFGDPRLSQYHNATVGGGTDMTKMNLSVTHNNDEGLMLNSAFERTAINFKLNQQIVEDKLDLDVSARITNMVTDGAGTSTNAQIKIKDAIQTRPVSGIADDLDIDLGQTNSDDDYQSFLLSLISPLELAEQDWRQRDQNRYVLNAGLTWAILEQLRFRTTFTTNKDFSEDKRFFGPLTGESFNNGGSMPLGQKTTSTGNSYRWLNTINLQYNEWDDHKIDFLLGQELFSTEGESTFVRAEQFRLSITPEELFANMSFGEFDRLQTSVATPTNRLSGFGRLDYRFKDRYMATVTFRADASSKFSEENRLGLFPALALGWKISEEPFLRNSNFVNELKLRASYGQTGNDRISSTATQFLFSPQTFRGPGFNDREQVYYQPSSSTLYNPDLVWETTINRNLGLDFALANDNITGSLDVYKNTTEDLLLQSAIPPTSGFNTQWNNVGSTSNQGVELGLRAFLVENEDFSLSTSFNIGRNIARIEELDGTNERFFQSNWASTDLNNINDYYLQVGGKVGDIYGYVTDGMYSVDDFAGYDEQTDEYILNEDVPSSGGVVGNTDIRPGFLKLKDLNDDGVINAEDRQVIGNALPDFQGGLGFDARWKGFDASIFFNFQYGNDVYNTGKIQFNQFRRVTYGNLLETMHSDNRFTYIDVDGQYTGTPGEVVTDLGQLAEMNEGKEMWSHASHGIAGAVVHSWAIEDGSFVRLNNLTLGYRLPENLISRFGLSQFRIYAAGRNLHLWTNYSGYDPEVNSTNSGLTPGVDYSSYPRSRSYTVGVNLSF